MNDNLSFQRFAAVMAIVSFPLAWGGTLLGLISANFDPIALSDPARMITISPDRLRLMNWSMLFYLLGYYLLLIPVVLILWRWLSSKSPNWAGFHMLCGLLYILLGTIASALAMGMHPPLISAYPDASVQQREMLTTAFAAFWYAQTLGLTGVTQQIPAMIWWIGTGQLLDRERRALRMLTFGLGCAALLGVLANVAQTGEMLAGIIFFITYVVIAPIWALWLGIDLLRKPVSIEA